MKRSAIRLFVLCIGLTALPLPAGEVARVGGEGITDAELEKAASVRLLRVRTEMYEVRRAAAETLATQTAVAKAAAAANLSPEAWLEREAAKRFVDVSQEEIEAAYSTMTGGAGKQSKEQEMADLARSMREVRRSDARREIEREMLAAAKVDLDLEPPRLAEHDLGGTRIHGTDNAPVTLVLFADFECPFSARVGPLLDMLRERYPEELRILHRDLPLAKHPNARKAAEAAACANDQGLFWEMAVRLYQNQQALDRQSLETYAVRAGADRQTFTTCLDSGRESRVWSEGIAAARRYAVNSTPTIFINGRLFAGVRDLATLTAAIDEELAR
ncbi:MAG TPA: thioredoxin domain-containing protein [Thermoanaerobaculia bacterium]